MCTVVAAAILRTVDPDVPDQEVFDGLHALLAGGIASSVALLVTVAAVVRPLAAPRLRLLPGREQGSHLLAVIAGTVALGQALDSIMAITGLGRHGAMVAIRRALESASGPDLFAAVVVIGLLAGTAEEIFFRGYMQTMLGERWPAWVAVLVTSLCFGLLHLEWRHAALAVALGLWLGFTTEACGSALPAVAAHVVNNTLFTVLTATGGVTDAVPANVWLLGGSATVFLACAVWLGLTLPRGGAAPTLRPLG